MDSLPVLRDPEQYFSDYEFDRKFGILFYLFKLAYFVFDNIFSFEEHFLNTTPPPSEKKSSR